MTAQVSRAGGAASRGSPVAKQVPGARPWRAAHLLSSAATRALVSLSCAARSCTYCWTSRSLRDACSAWEQRRQRGGASRQAGAGPACGAAGTRCQVPQGAAPASAGARPAHLRLPLARRALQLGRHLAGGCQVVQQQAQRVCDDGRRCRRGRQRHADLQAQACRLVGRLPLDCELLGSRAKGGRCRREMLRAGGTTTAGWLALLPQRPPARRSRRCACGSLPPCLLASSTPHHAAVLLALGLAPILHRGRIQLTQGGQQVAQLGRSVEAGGPAQRVAPHACAQGRAGVHS